ncbi:TRAP transporter small permease [Niallia sp. Krafla_26]|uniref:TRAP transporter small permease n=1 Tax=Niallia sp. Krafla_26 TaxID=3064703 RepID=UPI003D185520
MKVVIDRITEILTGSLLAFMVIIAVWQVFTRFVLQSPSIVTEEMLRYGLIWLTMVGGAYVYGKNQHLAIVFIARKFPEKIQPLIALFVEASVMIFAIVMLIMGGMNTVQNAVGQVSPALQMPMQYYYLSLPVGGGLFLFYSAFNLAGLTKKNKQSAETK